jgi:hypothetical protein
MRSSLLIGLRTAVVVVGLVSEFARDKSGWVPGRGKGGREGGREGGK